MSLGKAQFRNLAVYNVIGTESLARDARAPSLPPMREVVSDKCRDNRDTFRERASRRLVVCLNNANL